MADFRRCIIVLAALALLLGTVSLQAANTAPFTCISSATPAQMRAEGLTEKGGDFVLTCSGGTAIDPGGPTSGGGNPANQGPMVNIQIFLNTNVTSRILDTTTSATEALLMIDEPSEIQQKVCPVGATGCAVYGNGGGNPLSPYLAAGAYNVWQGQLAGSNSIVFNGVPILPPGTAEGNLSFASPISARTRMSLA